MKKMSIFEPAMCCETGLCGVSIDPELMRISTIINNLKKKGVNIDRYNLSNTPMEFINNKTVNHALSNKGPEILPLVLIDDEIIIEGRYPSNEEIMSFLQVPENYLDISNEDASCSDNDDSNRACGCNSGCC